jgi:hypothetical protein
LENQFNKAEKFAKHFISSQANENRANRNDDFSALAEEDRILFEAITDPKKIAGKLEFYQTIDTVESRRKVQLKIDKEPKVVSFRKYLTRGLKIAAVFLGLFVISSVLFYYLNDGQSQSSIADSIHPGSLQATLVLSDGEQIDLAKMSTEAPIEKDGMKIVNNNESIEYISTPGQKEQAEPKINTLIVPKGGEWHLVLEDGTKVWINADSKLTYPSKFNKKERIVQLEGEAYFEVAHDKEWPFMVKTTITETKVLGTSFNIKAYKNEDKVETTLIEGKVALNQSVGNSSILMDPGHQAIVSVKGGEVIYKKVDTAIFTSWKDKQFEFEEETLESILKSLERWYNVTIEFSDDDIKQLRFSARLKRYDSIQGLLNRIEQTNKVHFSYRPDKILVNAK